MSLLKKWGKFEVPKNANLQIGEEWVAPNEEQIHQQMAEMLRKTIEKKYQNKPVLRDAHPKDHGCVKAEFIVEENIPDFLKVGMFKNVKTYPAWIRYSTGSAEVSSDAQKEFLGMGIKVMDVEGEKILEEEKEETTQDFLLISVPKMPIRNANDFAKLVDATVNGNPLKFFFNPFDLHIKEFLTAISIKRQNANPLYLQYNSTTPYLFGQGNAVKYRVKPTFSFEENLPAELTPNYLREAMQEHLHAKEARFDFMVQLQKDPESMPIEDALVDWDENVSPYQKVATVVIPIQNFNTPEQIELAEQLSFQPWHSLVEHRPLGSLNRARKVAYTVISKFRHEKNKMPRLEPKSTDPSYPKGN